jgi:hypothetical protein
MQNFICIFYHSPLPPPPPPLLPTTTTFTNNYHAYLPFLITLPGYIVHCTGFATRLLPLVVVAPLIGSLRLQCRFALLLLRCWLLLAAAATHFHHLSGLSPLLLLSCRYKG